MNIGIIGAMGVETEKLINKLEMRKLSDNFSVYKTTINDNNIYLCESGIGKVNAACNTQHLIDTYNIDLIINTGCCGSLTDEVKVMDVVLVSYATYHDFEPERIMKYSTPNDGKIESNDKLNKLITGLLDEMNITNYHFGPIASGDCFVTNAAQRDSIKNKTGAVAVDMESASIAHVSARNNIGFAIIRTISDFADGEDDQEEKASNFSSNIVKRLIELI